MIDEETLNLSLRKFLKRVGISAQRHMESGVRAADEDGTLPENGRIAVRMTLDMEGITTPLVVEDEIEVR
jgi:hypothetical protein